MSPRTPDWIESVLARYERPLLQYAGSLCGNTEDARDVVQDTFLRLAEKGPLEEEEHLPRWLFTVCRNRALDLKRKEKRIVPMHPETEAPPCEEPIPSAQLERKEDADRLGRLLGHLPENQREVLRLRFQCDLSYREISEVTRMEIGTVGFLIHTGLKKLRQLWPQNVEVKP